jgi:NADPH:quinone reductase-like Zn-dependent oxidoreductase
MTAVTKRTSLDALDPIGAVKPESATQIVMKAVVATGYGSTDVLQLTERDRPTPQANEILIKIIASNVSAADSMMRRGDPVYARLFLGLRRPKAAIPGTGLAGVVEAVGGSVTRFGVGDEVFGQAGLGFGAHAEYVCIPEDGTVVEKPVSLSFEDAATMCDGPVTSLNFLQRMAKVEPGQKVLINGASGSLGTAAVQLAKAFGAEVTGVCGTAHVELVRSLGADRVIDYTQEDFSRNGEQYDVIYDTVGKSSFGRSKRALTPKGKYLSPVLGFALLLRMIWTSLWSGKRAMFDATGMRPTNEQRAFLGDLLPKMADGTLRIVTDRVYTLDQIEAAHAHVDGGHKAGNVIIKAA